MWSSGQFGDGDPRNLIRTVWILLSLVFGLRARDEARQMQWGDVTLHKDHDGNEHLEFQERATKTRTGGAAGGSRSFAPKAFQNKEKPDRCPVSLYKKYKDRRPASACSDTSSFFLAINHKRKPDSPIWYST